MENKTCKHRNIFFLAASLLTLSICFSSTGAGAQESNAWEPLTPPSDRYDWVQLTSGEWLKGEIRGLYNNQLEFDSKKLKLRTFKWKDVKVLRSPRLYGVRITGPFNIFGSFEIDEHKITVYRGGEKQEYPRSRIISLAPYGDREVDLWSGKVTLGINFTKGNSNQEQYNANASIRRRSPTTRFLVDYFGNISKTEGITTVESNRIQGQFDILKTIKYYYRPVYGEYYRDPIKNIKLKATIGLGMGYYFINTPRTEWEIGAGPGYQETQFDSVEPGESDRQGSAAILGGSIFNTELTEDIDFVFKYSFQVVNKVSGTYTHHTMTSLEIDFTDEIELDISFVWDMVQDPKPDDNGVIPDKHDYNLVLALGVKF